MKILLIINDAPYGTEKAYNALRMAKTIQNEDETVEIRIFLMADASTAALQDQNTPQGYYNIETMMKSVNAKGGRVKIFGSCAEARGISKLTVIKGTEMSTMKELVQWTMDSDKVLTF